MARLQTHLRNTLLAGIFAAIPIGVTIFLVVTVESATRAPLRALTGWDIPFAGAVLTVVLIYLLGLLVTSLVGKWVLRWVDRLLLRLPVLKELYKAWKQVSLTSGGREGIFARVVLVPTEDGRQRTLGFASGQPLDADPGVWCVFVPAAPNPASGRLSFLPVEDCQVLDLSVEEAFKIILSGGNYLPVEIGQATARWRR